jgi:hypothetical protein
MGMHRADTDAPLGYCSYMNPRVSDASDNAHTKESSWLEDQRYWRRGMKVEGMALLWYSKRRSLPDG